MKRIALLGVFVLLLMKVAAATTIVPMSVEDLTHSAGRIVQGHAIKSWSQWNPEHTLIYTYTRFAVTSTLKGRAQKEIVVKQLGGRAGGYTQKISGVRQLQNGEQAVLFLRPSVANDDSMVVVGLMQGHYRIYQGASGEAMASNGVPQLQSMARESDGPRGSDMSVGQLEQRIRRALTQ